MEGLNTTNAVQCSKCGTNNPRFFINCKKCGKKLDLMDNRVCDPEMEHKTNSTKWTPTTLLIFAVVFGTLFYFGLKIFGVGNHEKSSTKDNYNTTSTVTNNSYSTLSKSDFISKVKENQAVIDADITDVKYLYIAVIDDGINKVAMAAFYCRLARQYNVSEVTAVKIVGECNLNCVRFQFHFNPLNLIVRLYGEKLC